MQASSIRATVAIRPDQVIGTTDRRMFGAFVEHLGRCIYGGIFEPGHPAADAQGFRRDVLALVRELAPTIIRYPGGNFVSGYNWEDGVGPLAGRPSRLDLAWRSTETNRFGTNEFIDWCRRAEVEPMLAVNLGTRGADAARNLVEYCNHPGGTALSEMRRRHGWAEPHAIKFWCLGNEMDGPWQVGAKTAEEYARAATEAAKVMKLTDPTIEVAACGSSSRSMPTYGSWEATVLEHCFEVVDFLSLHTYLNNYSGDVSAFLASPDLIDTFIEEVAAIADSVAARRRSPKRIHLSFDEWNVWYRTRRPGEGQPDRDWPVAPSLLEEQYSIADALAVGGICIALLNHADRVKAACLAQLVNVIAPIMTETGGSAWRQTIFYPLAHFSNFGRGEVLRAAIEVDCYDTTYVDPPRHFPIRAPYLKFAAVHNRATATITIFALNRHLTAPMALAVTIAEIPHQMPLEARQLRGSDLQMANTHADPDRVTPSPLGGVTMTGDTLRATLAPASWNVIRVRAR